MSSVLRRRLAAGIAAIAVLAACGTPTATRTPPRPTDPGGSGGAGPSFPIFDGNAAPTVLTDTVITLHPVLYGNAGNPCKGAIQTTGDSRGVSGDCNAALAAAGIDIAPGQDMMTTYPWIKTARIAKGFDPASANVVANGYFVTQTLRTYAVGSVQSRLLSDIDGPAALIDPLDKLMLSGKVKYAEVDTCGYPTTLRVIYSNEKIRSYLNGIGFIASGDIVVVATYPACPKGVVLTMTDGTKKSILQHPKPVSIVFNGSMTDVPPLGTLWRTDGWASCGPDALQAACT